MSKQINKALITGITGQDGALMAKKLLALGYEVLGTVRDKKKIDNLKKLNISKRIELIEVDLESNDVFDLLTDHKPDILFHFAAQSSVGVSIRKPFETLKFNYLSTLNILEAVRATCTNCKVFIAGSVEIFEENKDGIYDESSAITPRTPYGISKQHNKNICDYYRDTYSLFIVYGILFNHESSLRGDNFVTSKIMKTAERISNGSDEKLLVGDLDIIRDWSWAPDVVDAIYETLKLDIPHDFVIGSGEGHTLKDFIEEVFRYYNLDWSKYTESSKEFFRKGDIHKIVANPSKAIKYLNWNHRVSFKEMIHKIIDKECSNE